MKKGAIVLGVFGGLLLASAGCAHLVYADGPYRGKVIDKDTKQPIKGAAVAAVWWKQTYGQAHPIEAVYDAQDTLTDQDGEFTIPGIVSGSLNPLVKIKDPRFYIFKPAYAAFGGWVFKPQSVSGKIESLEQDGRTVFALGWLPTREERLRNLDRSLPLVCSPADTSRLCTPGEKIPNLIRLNCIESVNLRLSFGPCEGDKGQ